MAWKNLTMSADPPRPALISRAAIFLTSGFFALMHAETPQNVPALFALSVALGYNYERCGRLYASILLHAVFNAVTLMMVLFGK